MTTTSVLTARLADRIATCSPLTLKACTTSVRAAVADGLAPRKGSPALARAAAEAEAARREEQRRQDAEDRRRQRDAEVRRVEAERREMKADDPWWPIPSWEVPEGVRFDTPGRNQGQIVEVSFGTFGRAEAGSIDPYMNVTDHSDGSSLTYKRRNVEG